jgi:hypothetical protein
MAPAAEPLRLRSHLPPAAWPMVEQWLHEHPVRVKVSRPRQSKLGDFRPAHGKLPAVITVNEDLNPYAFLVTLVHEFAHSSVIDRTRSLRDPHGREWKLEYHRLMRPFLTTAVFPSDVLRVLEQHLRNAPASSCADPGLLRALRRYDTDPSVHLEDLREHTIFRLHRKLYVKGTRLRKRFRCRCLNDRRLYLIDPLAVVHVDQAAYLRAAS